MNYIKNRINSIRVLNKDRNFAPAILLGGKAIIILSFFLAMQAFPTPYLKRNNSNIESSFEVNEYVQQFMRTQPPGYRDFQDYLTSAETTSYLFDQMGLPQNPKLIRASASAINKAFKNRQIPMHIILD